MKSLLLIPLILSLGLIPAFALQGEWAWEDFCEKKTTNSGTTAADFICELDIFQMDERITALEELTIPNYDRDVEITNLVFDVDTVNGWLTYTGKIQAFHPRSSALFSIIDSNSKPTDFNGGVSFLSLGLPLTLGGTNYDIIDWTDGVYTFQAKNKNDKIIFEQSFTISGMTTEPPITITTDKNHYYEDEIAVVSGTAIYLERLDSGISRIKNMDGGNIGETPNGGWIDILSDGTWGFEMEIDILSYLEPGESEQFKIYVELNEKRNAEIVLNYTKLN